MCTICDTSCRVSRVMYSRHTLARPTVAQRNSRLTGYTLTVHRADHESHVRLFLGALGPPSAPPPLGNSSPDAQPTCRSAGGSG